MKKSILLILIVISVLCTIVSSYINNSTMHYVFKPLSTVLVMLLPVLYAKNGLKPYKIILLIGLLFCLIGDVFLMFDAYFVLGLASFLIGHVFFVYAFTSINGFSARIQTLLPLVIISGLVFLFLKDHLGNLLIPVMLYITCIVLMAWQALNLYIWKKEYGFLLITIGAFLFLVSDSVLAINKFVTNFTIAQFLISSTYWSAITLIALSTIYINDKSKTDI
ncbi:lysoplasmalogenase [Lacinutrix sp. C3R15]|uniref:lysoplasmalogenase n=1 Tax=Flavobacteriaceae TaxID=49546 RepID=UPI001C09AEC2|nr:MULTISPECIES: lysoplasmalogenase [Flavobacteriaceae]MBU2937929.1 lysoplasmalogenase [Lacinutrix sp. C3R15]MDO6621243.1 lysoplasmalogenase [Oceanihabitans sp. 1_MG-2023]